MCIANGIPAIVGRFAEQSTKVFMWRDIGLGEWLFNFDQPESIAQYPQTVLSLITNVARARRLVARAQTIIKDLQASTVSAISV